MGPVEDEQHLLFDCPFYASIRGQHHCLFRNPFHQRDICLFFEANSGHVVLVALHVHLCFQARKRLTQSNEPQLATYSSYPGL